MLKSQLQLFLLGHSTQAASLRSLVMDAAGLKREKLYDTMPLSDD